MRHGAPPAVREESARPSKRALITESTIAFVTGYLEEAGAMLAEPRFAGSSLGAGLRGQISEFCSSPV